MNSNTIKFEPNYKHSPSMSTSQHKKRKHDDLKDINNTRLNMSPPKKRQKISKRPSKKPNISFNTSSPNSHVTITFANLNDTVDAIILAKENVLLISNDILLENKGKLSIKKSDLIQNDIAPQIAINIETLNTSNVKTIHPRNSFRLGTALFYCCDEERLFWSFPLRKTRRVSCQHYCCAANEKIVTRSVGIYSNKCNGKHNKNKSCIYAIANGKPPKGALSNNKLSANYQYFQHSAKTQLLIAKEDPIENSNNDKFETKNYTINDGPPPLTPMNDNVNDKCKGKYDKIIMKTEKETDNQKRKTLQLTPNGEPIPFQQNVQINLKALSEKSQKLEQNISCITSSSSIDTESDAHDYTQLLLHSTSSCIRDIEKNDNNNILKQQSETEIISNNKTCKQLLLNGEFDQCIQILKPLIPSHNSPHGFDMMENSNEKLNNYGLLMATALYYKNDTQSALHFCNLILSNNNNSNKSIEWYEAKKLRGLIHKDSRNYKAACHDFEFICFNNPYHKTWKDKLYLNNQKTNHLNNFNNKIICNKVSNNERIIEHHKPTVTPYSLLQQGKPNLYHNIPQLPSSNKPRLNEIVTTPSNIHVFQNNNYYQSQALDTLTLNMSKYIAQSMTNQSYPIQLIQAPPQIQQPHPMNINAPIVYVPPIMDRKKNNNNNRSLKTNAMSNINYNNDLVQLGGGPKGFPQQSISNMSFDGIRTGLERKTTREELLDDKFMNTNSSNNLSTNIPSSLDKSVSGTPEPLERIRSDALMN